MLMTCCAQGACLPGAPVIFADSLEYVCDVSRSNARCPPVSCTKLLAGWNSNVSRAAAAVASVCRRQSARAQVCTRYQRDSGGYCDATGTCLATCALVPAQNAVQIVRCASLGCIIASACQALTSTALAGSVC